MTGRFIGYGALVPPGHPLPTGTEQTLVVDMQGDVLDSSLNDNPEPRLADAGAVMQLPAASTS